MTGWSEHKGLATVLDIENVDTDQLIPARFMSTPRHEGYGSFLLHDLRFSAEGNADPDFPINRHSGVSILVGRRNFGSGSSREAAVYALADFGIRAVIAPSFGDIFASNSVNNGLLPALVSEPHSRELIAMLGNRATELTINIEKRTITVEAKSIPFSLSEAWCQKLINGWDDIDLTQHYRPAITAYRARRAQTWPWMFPKEESVG